ncbi:MAG: hypothetical protein ABEI31_04030 [Halodesulfurarchaeum sp.]
MSKANPLTTIVDMQRRAIEQQTEFVERSVALQKRLLGSVDQGIAVQQDLESQARSVAQSTVEATLDAIEASTPGEAVSTAEVREVLEEQFAAGEELSEEAWAPIESTIDEFLSSYEELLEDTEDLYHEVTEAYLEAVEQVETQAE